MKTLLTLFCFCIPSTWAVDKSANPLELKLTSLRAEYVVDRGGKSAEEFAAMQRAQKVSQPYPPQAIVLVVELKNTGAEKLTVFGAPRPKFVLKGPRAISVVETCGARFYGTPSMLIDLEPGQSVFLNEISYMPFKHARHTNTGDGRSSLVDPAEAIPPLGTLNYTVANSLINVSWTEAGNYTLHAEFSGGVTPGQAGALPFDDEEFRGAHTKPPKSMARVDIVSAPISLSVRDGNSQEYWLDALKDKNAGVRIVAASTLSSFRSHPRSNCAALVPCLKDTDARVRREAAVAINALYQVYETPLHNDEALRAELCASLIPLLKDEVPTVREASMRALDIVLSRTSDPSQIKVANAAIIPLLKDATPVVRACAAGLLRKSHWQRTSDPAVPALLEALFDNKEEVVLVSALDAIGSHGPDAAAAVPHIQRLYHEGSVHQKSSALYAAAQIGSSSRVMLPEIIAALKQNELRRAAVSAINEIGVNVEGLLPALQEILKAENDYHTRVNLIQAMGKVCGAAAVPTIQETLLNEKKDYVRNYAAQTLGYIHDPSAVAALLVALRDPSQQVRFTAIDALRSLKHRAEPALDALRSVHASDVDQNVRERSAVAIQEIGDTIEKATKK